MAVACFCENFSGDTDLGRSVRVVHISGNAVGNTPCDVILIRHDLLIATTTNGARCLRRPDLSLDDVQRGRGDSTTLRRRGIGGLVPQKYGSRSGGWAAVEQVATRHPK